MLTLLVCGLFFLYLIVRMAESPELVELYNELRSLWRKAGVPGRLVAILILVFCTCYGGSKEYSPIAPLMHAIFWLPGSPWQLSEPAASVEVARQAITQGTNDLSIASNLFSEVDARLSTQQVCTVSFGWPMRDRTPYHEEQNVMGENPWRSNVWINGELYHDHYISFNESVGTNPSVISIDYTARADDGSMQRWLENVITNSYPQTHIVQLESGSYTCYVFRCKCPPAITNSVIDWDREVVFGAPALTKRGFNIAGVFVVSKNGQLWKGRSYTNIVDGVTNLTINGIRCSTLEAAE